MNQMKVKVVDWNPITQVDTTDSVQPGVTEVTVTVRYHHTFRV